MTRTPARKEFKKLLGQANHFLITALIGLDYIKTSEKQVQKPEEFRTSWNPQDIQTSALRSRDFIIKSTLAWAVDSLDSYLTQLNRKPKLISDISFDSAMNSAKRSVHKKSLAVANYFSVTPLSTILIEVLITWRNNLTHYLAENELDNEKIEYLIANKETIRTKYSGLNIEDLLKKVYTSKSPTFKECASLIHVTHDFVEEIDGKILDKIDYMSLAKDIFKNYFQENKQIKISKVFGRSIEDRKKIIKNILMNNGCFNDNEKEDGKNIELDKILTELLLITPKDINL